MSILKGAGMMNAIEVHDLVKRFGDKTVVNDVSMSGGRRRDFGVPGAERLRQDNDDPRHVRSADAGRGRGAGAWPYDIRTDGQRIKREVGYMTQRFSFYEDLVDRGEPDLRRPAL
jgi:ABC-2 type transport system ATP-binding protein